jgi:hypothetical protein
VMPPVRATAEKVNRSVNSMGNAPFPYRDGSIRKYSFSENAIPV